MVRDTTVDAGCGAVPRALSPMQQGMLFHSVDRPAPGVDIEQVVCEMHHPVGAPEFAYAWRLMVRRHDTLRTSFVFSGGQEPRQIVLPPDQVSVSVRVLNFAADAEVEPVIEQYLAADRRLGFSSLKAPLARVALFTAGPEHAWFVFTYHHLVLDARGMFTLFKEALDMHDAFAVGRHPELPPARSYFDYISWLQSLDVHRAEGFWREHFRGMAAPSVLRLPGPTDGPVGDRDLPGELVMRFTELQTAWLRDAARTHGVTLNNLLQGAWALVLSRFTGEDDVVFGAVRACRRVPVEGADSMVGMLINTVPFRVRMAGAASTGHWLRDLREQWLSLRDFEHTPLSQVQRWSGLAQGRPLFETLFNYQDPSWIAALRRLGGIWANRSFEIRSQPNYPLALDIYGDEALLIRAFYNRDRFAAEAVSRMLEHFHDAITALADPHLDTLSLVPRLPAKERDQVMVAFNRTAADYPCNLCVQTAFEAHAKVTPDRLAVTDGHTELSYGELNRRANRLASRLRKFGVAPDKLVAVCMKRSAEMLVAWLGVLKAGGAFVPLDPGYPAERLAFQIVDCGARVLISQPELDALPLPEGVSRVDLAADGSGFEEEPESGIKSDATAANLAYVIYTSGSTGQPKGVEIEHRSLMNLVTWHRVTYRITETDRATQLASPAFDASVWECWPYLAAGASLHIPDDETRITPSRLWRWLADQRITVAFIPTPIAEAALSEPWHEGMALRALLTGGDRLRRTAPAQLPCTVYNHYGPTENTVVATACAVQRGGAEAPPIGRPIANTCVFVLDREMRLAPIGVPGELYIGGDSLARGYLNRPGLTEERFVLNPFADGKDRVLPGAGHRVSRLYRTGDIVRWRTDGQLEFLGRVDQQVKIRGCRIELGEISAALQRHAHVREAVVVARNDAHGHAQLLGYVVPVSGTNPTDSELIEFLRGLLPSYMIPAAIVPLAAWPLTPNGKVDTALLPSPDKIQARDSGTGIVPRTREEQEIATIWSDILGKERLELTDNFFDVGGHSLLAAQAVTRVNAALGVSVSVRLLFDHPTVADFARAIVQADANSAPRHPALRSKRRPATPELETVHQA